jgi:ABC-2 type transport system ATP-binding protein
VLVRVDGQLPSLTGVQAIETRNGAMQMTLAAETSPQEILQQLVGNHVAVEQFEIATPALDEIFISAVSEKKDS